MKPETQPLQGIIASQNLKQLTETVREQGQLLAFVKQILPSPVDQHCLAVVRKNGRATLYADSSVWASRMRYMTKKLILEFKNSGYPIDEARIRVLPPTPPPATQRKRNPVKMSKSTAKQLANTANSLEDSSLGEILLRISKHAQK